MMVRVMEAVGENKLFSRPQHFRVKATKLRALHWVRPNHLDRQSKKATFLSQRGGTDAANIFGRGAAVVVACNNRRPSCGIGHRGRAWIRRATKAARKNANAIGASGERQGSQGGLGKAGRSSRDGTR